MAKDNSIQKEPTPTEIMRGINSLRETVAWLKENSATKTELSAGLKSVNDRLDVGLKSVNDRLDVGLKSVNDRIDKVIEGSGWIIENMATKDEQRDAKNELGEKIDKLGRKLETHQNSLDNHDRRIEKVEIKLGLGAA